MAGIPKLAADFEDALGKLTGDNGKLASAVQAVQTAQQSIATDTPVLASAKDALIVGINEAFTAATTPSPTPTPAP